MTPKYLFSLWDGPILKYVFDRLEDAIETNKLYNLSLRRIRVLEDNSVTIMNL
jgi:hypothetical protein